MHTALDVKTRGSVHSIGPKGVYLLVAKYAGMVGIDVDGFGPRMLRTMARINTLEHNGDLSNFQEWARPKSISIKRIYEPVTRSRSASLRAGTAQGSSR